MSETDFERNVASGGERCEGVGDEAAIDIEAIAACKEGQRRFVVAHFNGERGAVGMRHVGGIGYDDVEDFIGDRGEQVSLEKANAGSDAVHFRIFARDVDGGGGKIGSCDVCLGQLVSERDGDCSRAGADVNDARREKTAG